MVRPVYCFIDDARFELDNFRANAAPAFAPIPVLYAQTYDQARAQLDGCVPLCFLLDIYGFDPAVIDPAPPPEEELGALAGGGLDLSGLYQDLDQGPEGRNAFLRGLYAQVEAWQKAFLLAAEGLGQGRAYGLANLARARSEYPWAAALGYSRKALYADAMAMSGAGADGLLQKPQGEDERQIAEATRQGAPFLAQAARRAVAERLSRVLAPLGLRLSQEPGGDMIALAVLEALRLVSPAGLGAPVEDAGQVAATLARAAGHHPGLGELERGALEALAAWTKLEH